MYGRKYQTYSNNNNDIYQKIKWSNDTIPQINTSMLMQLTGNDPIKERSYR